MYLSNVMNIQYIVFILSVAGVTSLPVTSRWDDATAEGQLELNSTMSSTKYKSTTTEDNKESDDEGNSQSMMVFVVIGCAVVGIPSSIICCCCCRAFIINKLRKTHPQVTAPPPKQIKKPNKKKLTMTLEETERVSRHSENRPHAYLQFHENGSQNYDRPESRHSSSRRDSGQLWYIK